MTDMLLPVGGAGAGGAAGAAAAGALGGAVLGSLVFGRGGLNGVDGGVGVNTVQSAVDTNAILTGINDLSTQTGQLGMNLVQGQNTLGMTVIQGQNTTNTTVERAAASTYTGLTAQNTQSLLASVQGFAGLNTVIQNGTNSTVAAIGAASALATNQSFEARLAAERCCCETNLNIERQGNATRDLMRQQFADSQAVLICDMKSQLQQRDFLLSQAAQTAQLRCEINQNAQLINFKLPTPPTPPTGCC